jgi:hypothetical protein
MSAAPFDVQMMDSDAPPVVDRTTEHTARRHPWFKFFPSDWQGDELLPTCSLAARGLLAEFICIMHKATPYGHLLVNGRQPVDAELTRLVRATSPSELRRLRKELLDRGVLSTTDNGTVYSRRMVRKAKQSAIGHETGKRGGNPALKALTPTVNPQPLTPPLRVRDNTHIPEARSQNPLPPSGALVDERTGDIAGAFLERYPEVYARCRNGASYRVNRLKQERDLAYAQELALGWPDLERLEAMLEIFLRRTDLGDKNKPGTPGQFLHMAPDCDRLLKEHGR